MANLSKIIQLVTEHLQNGEEILRDDNKPIIIEGQYETKILNNDSIRTRVTLA